MNAINISKKWLLFFPLVWFIGLTPIYSLLLIPLGIILLAKPPHNGVFIGFTAFAFVQLICTGLAVFGPFDDPVRFAAILHNIYLYIVLIFGMLLCLRYDLPLIINEKQIGWTLIIFAFFSALIFYYSLNIAHSAISIPGILGDTRFTRLDYLFNSPVPRLSFMGDYVNTTAMLALFLLALFILAKQNSGITFSILVFTSAFAVAAMAGSRVVLFSALLLLPFTLTKSPKALLLTLFATLIVTALILTGTNALEFIEGVQSSRENSSNARMSIYTHSFETMMDVNPFTGLGLKPVLPYVTEFPLGSHSTFFGYIIKCGMLGFCAVFIYFMWVILKFIYYSYSAIAGRPALNGLIGFYIIASLSIVLCFEDIDSYAINSFLFGMIIGSVLKKESATAKNTVAHAG